MSAIPSTKTMTNMCVSKTAERSKSDVAAAINRFWEILRIGIKHTPKASEHYDGILEVFIDTLEMKNGRYHVSFPWKSRKLQVLCDNRNGAESRLESLFRQLSKSEEVMRYYDTAIRQHQTDGHSEEVSSRIKKLYRKEWTPRITGIICLIEL